MTDLLRDLKIVVIDNPTKTWAESLTTDLFTKTVDLKLRGYGVEYQRGVLPIDTSDFYGVHQLVCRQTSSGLVPLMGYRSTTLERSRLYGQTFGGLSLVRAANAAQHDRAIQDILNRCESQGRSITYTGSWTIDPEARKNPELSHLLNELFAAMYVLFHLEAGIQEIITGGTLRFKVDRLLVRWGHEYLQSNGTRLPPIRVANLVSEPVVIMHLREFSHEVREQVNKWRFFWNQRLMITVPSDSSLDQKSKAA
ncbi:MAG: hypothetical protein A2X94_00505 [Bdellovibrionales bacterium GWB1_55_8]|nr:MAG: hypothetical protein A2X94_00505 [Bdellovibrionales bacterium GWB1_55_8]